MIGLSTLHWGLLVWLAYGPIGIGLILVLAGIRTLSRMARPLGRGSQEERRRPSSGDGVIE